MMEADNTEVKVYVIGVYKGQTTDIATRRVLTRFD